MGYRSDVCLCLKKNSLVKFDGKLSLARPDELKSVGELFASAEHLIEPETGAELFVWTDIKWYPDYDDVSFITNMLSEMDISDYHFIRTGEDSDDNEELGAYWDTPFELYLDRKICFERPNNGNC